MVRGHAVAGHAHHQHEVHEAVGGVARGVQAVERHLGEAALEVAAGDPVDGLAVEVRVGAVRAELARAAELERQVAGADDRDPTVVGPGLDELPDRPAQLDEPLRLRQRRREDVGVDRHDRQVVLGPQRDDRAGDAVVDPQLVAEGQVEAGVQAVAQDVLGEVLLARQGHPGQAELALLVVPVGVVEGRLADQELRHVVQPQLVEVVAADHHQDVGPGPRERLAEGLDLADPLVRERRPVGSRRRARAVVERVVRRGDDRNDLGHAGSYPSVGFHVDRVAVDGEVGVHADRASALLGDLAEQPGRPGQQGEPAEQLDRQPEVGQGRAADAGAVEGQPAAEHLLVRAADGLEQPQVRAAQALLLGDPDEHGGPGVLDLVHRVAETRDVPAGLARAAYGVQGDRVPAGVVGGRLVDVVEGRVQVGAAVLGDPEEARPAAQQAGGERALQRVGRGEVREAGGDRRRGEAVVGQRDQHRLEDADLLRRGPAHRHQPERQLAEADLAHQVGRQVLAEQPDLVGGRGAERGRELSRSGRHGSPPARRGSRRRARRARAAAGRSAPASRRT